MSLKFFLDDSSQEGGWYVLAGFIASEEAWARFCADWLELLPRFGILSSDNNYHFKMTEMMSTDERRARVIAFERVIYSHAIAEVCFGLEHATLNRTLSRFVVDGNVPILKPRITPFHVVFFALVEHFSIFIAQTKQNLIKSDIELIFDCQTEAKQITQYWAGFIESHPYVQAAFKIAPKFVDDKDQLPVQAADYLAWHFRSALQSKHGPTWGAAHKNPGFPSVCGVISEETMTTIYYGILRRAFSDQQIVDLVTGLSQGELDNKYLAGWKINIGASADSGLA